MLRIPGIRRRPSGTAEETVATGRPARRRVLRLLVAVRAAAAKWDIAGVARLARGVASLMHAAQGARAVERRLAAAVLASIAITIAALVAAAWLDAPARFPAETAGPPQSVLTAPVEQRILAATLPLRGRVVAEQTVDVVARGAGDAPVVSAVKLKHGDRVNPGQVLVEISGRPVFALPGNIPSYRDLRPGATGGDVAQLQAALRSLGFRSDDPDGTYGAGTKREVLRFYRSRGYEPRPASDADDALTAQAQRAVTRAERALRDARIALDQAQRAGEQRLAAARRALADRTEDLNQAERERDRVRRRTGPIVPAGEVVFLGGFPGQVEAVGAPVGAAARETLLTVSSARLVVKGELTSFQNDLVERGLQVQLHDDVTGVTAAATVQSVTATRPRSASGSDRGEPGSSRSPDGAYEFTVVPRGALDPTLAGQQVRLTVVADSTEQPVLVVPLAAVSEDADGQTSVTVVTHGERRRVEVTSGLVGDGHVQVTPLGGAELAPDDQVLVGT